MSLFRPSIEGIEGYVPGEQPQEDGWTKLNTNENPYPPSPRVVAAIESAAHGRLNVYPDPLGREFCRVAAEHLEVDPEWILPANGSDENLTILMRSFVDAGEQVAYPYPSYILYETLADIQGARGKRLLLTAGWEWDWQRTEPVVSESKLVFVPNPNSPSGNLWPATDLARLIPPGGLLVVDEAYADFSDAPPGLGMLESEWGSQVVVTRTLSKSYSLAGLRFGFAVAHPDLIRGMRKVKDSYNCDAISLAAAAAALDDREWMLANRAKILATRARLTARLRELGFSVVESQANFVWATHADHDHEQLYEQLKQQKVLVRYMRFEAAEDGGSVMDGLRVTVGTDEQIDRFLEVLSDLL